MLNINYISITITYGHKLRGVLRMININKEMLQIFACIIIWHLLCFVVPYVGY